MTAPADTAWALLNAHRNGEITLTRAACSFCGELLADPRPLTEKQADWLQKLAAKAGLPSLELGGVA